MFTRLGTKASETVYLEGCTDLTLPLPIEQSDKTKADEKERGGFRDDLNVE